jgi:thiosulfate dehydrogenase
VSSNRRKAAIVLSGVSLAGILFVAIDLAPNGPAGNQAVVLAQSEEAQGQALADSLMDQWKRKNPSRVEDWITEEKERHALQPPYDNSELLGGAQEEGQTYAEYTERDLLMWERETEKLVVDGSRIFHDAQALGGTVGVSCDMCHPHASNTHPETYPKFQAQLGRVALLRDMINWCIEQPVRGDRMDPDDERMRALEAYIYAQRRGKVLSYGKH